MDTIDWRWTFYLISILALLVFIAACLPLVAEAESRAPLPSYLQDRGPGIPTSMFGTYVEEGEWLFYPFFEYYLNDDEGYSPQELGYELDEDFRGEYRGYEGLIFLG